MPHYADGVVAQVGDQVFGVLYNSGSAPRAGTIVSITPGVDHCNAMVAFHECRPYGTSGATVPNMARGSAVASDAGVVRWKARSLCHQQQGDDFETFPCVDYCRIADLTFVSRGEL